MNYRRIFIYCSLAIVCGASNVSYADKAYTENKKGISTYSEKKFDESVEHFTDALVDRPESPEIKFNLGTSQSITKKTDDALKNLESAANELKGSHQQAAAYFNSGNTRYLAGDLEGAITDYCRAVKLHQESKDIRHNLELALRKQKEQQQQQQQKQDSDQDQKKDDKKQDEKKDEKNKTKDSDEQQQQDKDQQQSNQQNSEDRPMTPEEAKRILDALSDEEKKALSLKRMQTQQEMRQGDDW